MAPSRPYASFVDGLKISDPGSALRRVSQNNRHDGRALGEVAHASSERVDLREIKHVLLPTKRRVKPLENLDLTR